METLLLFYSLVVMCSVNILAAFNLANYKFSSQQKITVFSLSFLGIIFYVFLDPRFVFLILVGALINKKRKHERPQLKYLINFAVALILSLFLYTLLLAFSYHFLGFDYIYLQESVSIISILFPLIQGICLYFITYYLGRFMRKSIYPKLISLSKEIKLMVFLCLAITILAFLFNSEVGSHIGYTDKMMAFNCAFLLIYVILLMVIMFFCIRAYTQKAKQEFKLAQYNNLLEYTSNIEQLNSQLSTFKHDYINIMSSMSYYLTDHDYTNLTTYFNDHILPLNEDLLKNDNRLKLLRNIEIPELKGILSAKFIYAYGLGINLNIEIFDKISTIRMDLVDLSRILGIYLDNAIEAAQETSEQMVNFSIIKESSSVTILLTNTFSNQNIPISILNQKSFSTKGPNRGLGLYNVDQILSHYKNVIKDTCIEDNLFIQHLTISE